MIDKSAGFYVVQGDILWWQFSGIFPGGCKAKITYRIIGEDNMVQDYATPILELDPAVGGQTQIRPSHAVIPIAGQLVSAVVMVLVGPQRGTCYFQLMVTDSAPLSTDTNIKKLLICRHIQNADFYGWPDSVLQSIHEAPSHIAWEHPSDPALSSDYSAQIQGSFTNVRSERIKLLGFRGTLKTSAALPTRRVALQLKGGPAVVAHVPSPATQGPSETKNYYWAIGANTNIANNNVTVALPITFTIDNPYTGFLLATNTINLQEGDQWSGLQLFFEGWGTW